MGLPGAYPSATFLPDGRRVVTAHEDGGVRTWFVHTEDLVDEASRRLQRVGARR